MTSIASIPPTNGTHQVAIAIPLVATAHVVVALWVTFADSKLSLILALATLIVMILLGLITACGAFARNVEADGTATPLVICALKESYSRWSKTNASFQITYS